MSNKSQIDRRLQIKTQTGIMLLVATHIILLLMTLNLFSQEKRSNDRPEIENDKRPISEQIESVFLVDLSNKDKKLHRSKEPYFPHKIYMRFEPRVKKWVFQKTNKNGELRTEPTRFLWPPDSVLRGDWLGFKRSERYKYVGRRTEEPISEKTITECFEKLDDPKTSITYFEQRWIDGEWRKAELTDLDSIIR